MSDKSQVIQKTQGAQPSMKVPFDKGSHLKFKSILDKETGQKKKIEIGLSNGETMTKENFEAFKEVVKKTTGAEDVENGIRILSRVAYGMKQDDDLDRLNAISALLPGMRPQDETETALLGQFIALQESGFRCLRQANADEGFYHIERFALLATKLLNTANQTMQALLKYRSKGQQTVQVIHFHNEGQAIVTQNLSSLGQGRGSQNKTMN